MAAPFYSFQVEHKIPQVFLDRASNPDHPDHQIYLFLQRRGVTNKDMLGNLVGLFSNPDVAAQIQALPDGNPWKAALSDPRSPFGAVVHNPGPGDNLDGFQNAKPNYQLQLP